MSELFNETYYSRCCGPIPYKDGIFPEFFSMIATRIVQDLHPASVLDAGCAMGYLVAALRDQGVEAWGVDISSYAIENVREDVRPYCFVGSLAEPLPEGLPRRYDLVVTIEVLEHLYAEDGEKAIQNLCSLADHIIFSSSPKDFTEQTHFNVQQREYWAKLFLKQDFYDDLNYRPIYITPWAMSFRHDTAWSHQVEEYEHHFRLMNDKCEKLCEITSKYQTKIKEKRLLTKEKTILEQMLNDERAARIIAEQKMQSAQSSFQSISNSHIWRVTKPLRVLLDWGKSKFGRKQQELTSPQTNSQNDLFDNLSGYIPYDSEYQDNVVYQTAIQLDVKMLAFYLPQFHVFPENDKWWGKGFTEWFNVHTGTPCFEGHYQPRVPHRDIGYYFLDNIDVIKKQAQLAKEHGIYGFCIHYYWFSGKRLMEKPLDLLLTHPEIDIHFCLCWANENWTRTWSGMNDDILIQQDYSARDNELFIQDIKKYFDDSRYIRIQGKPLLIVYNPGQIPDCHKTFSAWRKKAREIGIGEILIWVCQTANNTAESLQITDCVDAEVEFPPHNMWVESAAIHNLDLHGRSATILNYQRVVDFVVDRMKIQRNSIPLHRCCTMAWDNFARRKHNWLTMYAFSLKSLFRWVKAAAEQTRNDFAPEERVLFINAWNEWGEGTYLEPDEKYGYANINTVSKALYDEQMSSIGGHEEKDTSILRRVYGFCPCCEQNTTFVAWDYWLRDFYACTKCGSMPRHRALMKTLMERFPNLQGLKIHESSPDAISIKAFSHRSCDYSYSYFYGNLPLGENLPDGGTNQDLSHLTFPDNTFDIFISQDVMEHVYEADKAFREIERVLKPGGIHIFTTPIWLFTKTTPRVRFDGTSWVNILPPMYHGDPINENGALVTYDWGDDIMDFIDAATEHTTTEIVQFMHTKENYEMGIEADFLQVLVSKKL